MAFKVIIYADNQNENKFVDTKHLCIIITVHAGYQNCYTQN